MVIPWWDTQLAFKYLWNRRKTAYTYYNATRSVAYGISSCNITTDDSAFTFNFETHSLKADIINYFPKQLIYTRGLHQPSISYHMESQQYQLESFGNKNVMPHAINTPLSAGHASAVVYSLDGSSNIAIFMIPGSIHLGHCQAHLFVCSGRLPHMLWGYCGCWHTLIPHLPLVPHMCVGELCQHWFR